MAKSTKNTGPAARLPKGFRDTPPDELRATQRMLDTIRRVYESYGFEPLETPAIEYTDALGKFLPDQDRPNEGVFSFQDEDEQWLSLRYDLTAPLARYVAAGLKEQKLALPFRRYAVGPVWRNEKPGPGRFRQFTQFDADTVGTDNIAADAEICMLAADTLEALGIKRGEYVIKVNNRKLLDGVLEKAGLPGNEDGPRRLIVLRAIDKFDKFGADGVRKLLGPGRKDESGDFTKGAGLASDKSDVIVDFLIAEKHLRGYELNSKAPDLVPGDEYIKDGRWIYSNQNTITGLTPFLEGTNAGETAIGELEAMFKLLRAAEFGSRRIRFDSSVVRGLEYYTGPVFEAEILTEVKNDGQTVRFGSVGGGGRYDGLVERFLGTKVPATGFSIGVSRLQAALAALNKNKPAASDGPVVVLVMPDEKGKTPDYARFQKMVQRLRKPNDGGPPIRAEMYLGIAGLSAQMKYADKRRAPCIVVQGSEEHTRGEVQIKDLIEGAKASATIKDNKEWREARPAQVSVPEANLVAAVRDILARHRG